MASRSPARNRSNSRLRRACGVSPLTNGTPSASPMASPFVSGETPHARRSRLFDRFRAGDLDAIVVSRVGDEGIDLPDAEVAVVASGLGGSRRQGTQRAGRTMRPDGSAHVVVLATRGTTEEEFAQNQQRHLASKGISVRDRDAKAFADADGLVADPTADDSTDEEESGEGSDAESAEGGDE